MKLPLLPGSAGRTMLALLVSRLAVVASPPPPPPQAANAASKTVPGTCRYALLQMLLNGVFVFMCYFGIQSVGLRAVACAGWARDMGNFDWVGLDA